MYHPLVQMKILVSISQDISILSLKPNAPLPPSSRLPRIKLPSIQTPLQCAFISLQYLTSLCWVTSFTNLCLPSVTLHHPIPPPLWSLFAQLFASCFPCTVYVRHSLKFCHYHPLFLTIYILGNSFISTSSVFD